MLAYLDSRHSPDFIDLFLLLFLFLLLQHILFRELDDRVVGEFVLKDLFDVVVVCLFDVEVGKRLLQDVELFGSRCSEQIGDIFLLYSLHGLVEVLEGVGVGFFVLFDGL